MDYFKNVQSLSELKAQYRQLVLANHPDKEGDTEVMQVINDAFGKFFKAFQDGTHTSNSTSNGFENDFSVQQMNIPNMYMQNTGGLEIITLPATIPRS